jgi:uncharacterized protein YaiL (DUF2058 family)
MQKSDIVRITFLALLFTFVGVGCAVKDRPGPSIEAAHLAIDEANRNEAGKYAPAELGIAEAKLTSAEHELASKNAAAARRLAEQAAVDARYAQVRAQAEKAQAAAAENRDTTETIQGVR